MLNELFKKLLLNIIHNKEPSLIIKLIKFNKESLYKIKKGPSIKSRDTSFKLFMYCHFIFKLANIFNKGFNLDLSKKR